MDDYENATKLEEDQEIYEEIETANEDIKKDPMLKCQTAHGNIKDTVLKIETAHGNIKNDPVLNLSLKKWLQFVLLPLLIVSVLSISLILTVAYFALYAQLESKIEEKYDILMKKQDSSATEIRSKVSETRAELEFQMEEKYAFLMKKQNISAKEIHAVANQARVAVTACVSSDQTFSDSVVRFSTVNYQVGINNIDTFKSSGKFVCEISGLYYISAHIYTSTQSQAVYVKKNSITIASSATDSDDSYSTNPISAVLELQLNDTLYVLTSGLSIRGTYSCVSIMKVK